MYLIVQSAALVAYIALSFTKGWTAYLLLLLLPVFIIWIVLWGVLARKKLDLRVNVGIQTAACMVFAALIAPVLTDSGEDPSAVAACISMACIVLFVICGVRGLIQLYRSRPSIVK